MQWFYLSFWPWSKASNSRGTKPSPWEVRPGCTGPRQTIRHFRVSPGLCIKTRLSARPLIWKWFFILMQIKLIFTRKVVHLASFWKWGFLELGSGLFRYKCSFFAALSQFVSCSLVAWWFCTLQRAYFFKKITKGAFHLSELASRTIATLVS